jgi:phage terminase small subunit
MNLTPKQEAFILEYLKDLNATQAAIRAGYSPKAAAETGYANLRKPQIQAALAERLADLMATKGIEADHVLEELRRVAFSDMRDFASWGPDHVTLVASDQLTDEQARAVKKVKLTETSTTIVQKDGSERTTSRRQIELELYEKLTALDKLGQYLKLFGHVEHQASDEIERGVALLPPEIPQQVLTFEN